MNKKIVKISIYNSRCTPSQVMQGNGDAILDNICIDCIPDENLKTGEYYLDAIFLIDREGLWKHIQEESILKVQMDYGEEYFRIAKITSTSRDITVFARQETIYQTLHMWLTDVRPENQNGQGALTHMKDNATGPKNIKVFSDISAISTAYYQDMNMYKALHDCDQSFLNRWGGEIQRRGYTLTINKRIGTHRGVQIRSRKNLTGFEANVDMDNVFTRIKPKGFDGITIDGFVDSPLINNYPLIKTITIKYDDVKVKDPDKEDDEGFETLEEAQAELIRRSELEFSQKHIDKVQASYRINFVQLEKTEEYKNYVAAERVFLGDEIDVYEETLDIELTVRAIRRKYDVLRERVLEVELSNEVVKKKPPTISDVMNGLDKIENVITENDKWYTDAINNATDLIQNGLKDSYVIVRQNEIIIGDTQDINTMTNVWRWNKGGLGFSKTGYFGEFGTAITMDGSIVATFITTGVFNAALIKAGILKSFNQKTWINMENGTFNFADKVKYDGTTFSVDLSGEDLSTNESMKAIIKVLNDSISTKVSNGTFDSYKRQTAEEISSKVSNGDFQSYKNQTAFDISQKVSSGDLYSLITQNARAWGLSIWGGLYGTNYTFDGNNFSIGTTNGNDKAYHSNTYSRWNHHDGSYTMASSNGLEHYSGGYKQPYHYMFDVALVDANGKCNGTWFRVQLPQAFRGKRFTLAWQMGNLSVPYDKVSAGHQVDVRNIDYDNATCEVSVKVFTKSKVSGGASADAGAYGWAKIFILY